MLVLLSIFVIALVSALWLYLKLRFLFPIKGAIIHMQKPLLLSDNTYFRTPFIKNTLNEKLIADEAFLRKLAYTNTTIKTGDSFFDDSDMKSDYYLVVIYDKKTNVPLLSSRYYFDQTTIAHYLKGDAEASQSKDDFLVSKFKPGTIFLSDRLSGNTTSSLYRQCRDYVFVVFFMKIYTHNKNCKFILMARRERYEKLLTKYLRIGLNVVGSTLLRGKEHWILLGDLQKIRSHKRLSIFYDAILLLKITFHK